MADKKGQMKLMYTVLNRLFICIVGINILMCQSVNAQQNTSAKTGGLEGIIVEKYYVSTSADQTNQKYTGTLPIGSITYRIYVDLLPGYRFQAAYGNKNHPLIIKTSTNFFNNTEIGASIPNIIPKRCLKNNTVMLDSWLSVGSAGEDFIGVLKRDDDTLETMKHEGGFLQNKTKKLGISLSERDGLISSENIPRPTFFSIDSIVGVFDKSNTGNSFITTNGAWVNLGKGSVGIDSLGKNHVLIAQITTDGLFEFELNIQLGTPDGKIQKFVAKNPIENELTIPELVYSSKKKRTKIKQKK